MAGQTWSIYLSGEIHSDWREQIADGAKAAKLPVEFLSAITDHQASDTVGARILGPEADTFWYDHKAAGINAIRIRNLLDSADLVVVRFGDKYKQWNAAFEAGYAVAIGTPIITLHDGGLNHALKDIDAAAQAVAETPEQVVQILAYVTQD
jgi:YtoQ family protein